MNTKSDTIPNWSFVYLLKRTRQRNYVIYHFNWPPYIWKVYFVFLVADPKGIVHAWHCINLQISACVCVCVCYLAITCDKTLKGQNNAKFTTFGPDRNKTRYEESVESTHRTHKENCLLALSRAARYFQK